MVLLGEEAEMEAHFSRLEMMLILTRDGCTVGTERTIGSKNHFGRTRRNSYVTWVMWNLVLVYLEAVLVSVQDRCTVCAERTIGSKNHFGHTQWNS